MVSLIINFNLEPQSMYIAIEGVIGVGKTTLARKLQDRFDAELQLEVFEENPFLADFYQDRERYAFQTQIFFLLSRYHQQRRSVKDIVDNDKNLMTDYTFSKDALFASINLKGDELEMYYRVHEALKEKIRPPDLIIFLQADTDVLMKRISLRDRVYERGMDREYIDILNNRYNEFFTHHYQGPDVLSIDTNSINFVDNPEDLDQVENMIWDKLKKVAFQADLIP
jgi:deoxyguanosine kinase